MHDSSKTLRFWDESIADRQANVANCGGWEIILLGHYVHIFFIKNFHNPWISLILRYIFQDIDIRSKFPIFRQVDKIANFSDINEGLQPRFS